MKKPIDSTIDTIGKWFVISMLTGGAIAAGIMGKGVEVCGIFSVLALYAILLA